MYRSIQFIGTQRSGSNLLRLILNQHNAISAPHPPHLLHVFYPLLPAYQKKYKNWITELAHDMCKWVAINPVPWTQTFLDPNEISAEAESIFDIVRLIYIHKAKADNAEIWCCKSTFNVHLLPEVERNFRPFYIHLYRDGRDVAVSFKKAYVGPKHVYFVARQWADEQRLCLNFLKNLPDDRKFTLSYEALLTDPKGLLQTLCTKLNISFSDSMLEYYKSEESIHTAEAGKMWEHVKEPILHHNYGKFFKELSEDEIGIFEKVAGEMLVELGYRLVNESFNHIKIDEAAYRIINDKLAETVRKNASSQEIAKRKPQEDFLIQIKKKLGLLMESINSPAS